MNVVISLQNRKISGVCKTLSPIYILLTANIQHGSFVLYK